MEAPVKDVDNLVLNSDSEDVVNPWNVTSASEKGVDYDKLISEFIFFVLSLVFSPSNVHRDYIACTR